MWSETGDEYRYCSKESLWICVSVKNPTRTRKETSLDQFFIQKSLECDKFVQKSLKFVQQSWDVIM